MKYWTLLILAIITLFYLFNFFKISEDTIEKTPATNNKTENTKTAPPVIPLKERIKARLDKESINGVVFASVKDQVYVDVASGFANVKQNIENKQQTEFLVGSITKLFTATAILKLEELGKINLKEPISTYLKKDNPIWDGNFPSFADAITTHDLLSHSSGLEDYTKFASFTKFNLELRTTADLLQFFDDYPLMFKPGSHYDYSRSNYIVLGALIEEITKKSYGEFLNEIFKPLDIPSTSIPKMEFLSSVLNDHPILARGYMEEKFRPTRDIIKIKLTDPDDLNLSTLFSDASAISNAHDLKKWIKALFNGEIISEDQLNKMTTPYFETRATNIFAGYGLFIKKDGTKNPIYINVGQLDGYEAYLGYEPKKDVLVIVLSNVINGMAEPLAKDLMQLLTEP